MLRAPQRDWTVCSFHIIQKKKPLNTYKWFLLHLIQVSKAFIILYMYMKLFQLLDCSFMHNILCNMLIVCFILCFCMFHIVCLCSDEYLDTCVITCLLFYDRIKLIKHSVTEASFLMLETAETTKQTPPRPSSIYCGAFDCITWS